MSTAVHPPPCPAIVAGARHGAAVPGAGEMSGAVSARPYGHQQPGADVHVVRLSARQQDRVVQRHRRVRGVHVLSDPRTSAPRGHRRAGAGAEQRPLHRSVSVV